MKRTQQSSILSFFQPRSTAPPSADAPPKNPNLSSARGTTTSPPPPPKPLLEQPQPQLSPPENTATTAHPPRIPLLPSPPLLPSQASIVPVAEHHIPALRRINSLLLPVAYPDSFYSKALNSFTSGLFSRVILWKDADSPPDEEAKVVGGLICRLEPNQFLDEAPPTPHEQHTSLYAIYIQSLALLSPYRSQGLAAAALEHIIASAIILPSAGSTIDVRTLYAHVWTENVEALKWYESRGFIREGRHPLQGYYFKLRPDTAWIMRRDIGPGTTAPAARVSSPNATNTATSSVLSSAINLPAISQPPPPITNAAPPRQLTTTSASSAASSSLSFQNSRPETEWNDLPDDMVQKPVAATTNSSNNSNTNLLSPTPPPGSNGGSTGPTSSRSSSTARKKRTYPTAAFGQ